MRFDDDSQYIKQWQYNAKNSVSKRFLFLRICLHLARLRFLDWARTITYHLAETSLLRIMLTDEAFILNTDRWNFEASQKSLVRYRHFSGGMCWPLSGHWSAERPFACALAEFDLVMAASIWGISLPRLFPGNGKLSPIRKQPSRSISAQYPNIAHCQCSYRLDSLFSSSSFCR